jgi:hypothetical protein
MQSGNGQQVRTAGGLRPMILVSALAIIAGVAIYLGLRYRRRRGQPAGTMTTRPTYLGEDWEDAIATNGKSLCDRCKLQAVPQDTVNTQFSTPDDVVGLYSIPRCAHDRDAVGDIVRSRCCVIEDEPGILKGCPDQCYSMPGLPKQGPLDWSVGTYADIMNTNTSCYQRDPVPSSGHYTSM